VKSEVRSPKSERGNPATSGIRYPVSDIRHLAFIALGSNLGDSPALMRAAMDRLEAWSAAPLRRSSLWQSSPVDCPPGSPVFVNAVVALTPSPGETPESLLEKLQTLELEFGRRPKTVRNEPRPLDLDLIAFGREERNTPGLTLPHPRAHRRRFVLEPLVEVAPELRPPGWPASAAVLLRNLISSEVLTRLPG
jgi:2-amino-4-hydroxy-6-hydroxymethyldihydropteridine diphosphokinase